MSSRVAGVILAVHGGDCVIGRMRGSLPGTLCAGGAFLVLTATFAACGPSTGGDTAPGAPQTLAAEREAFRKHLITGVIEDALSRGPAPGEDSTWEAAFWGMELASYTSAHTGAAIERAFQVYGSQGQFFRRALLEVVYALYPESFVAATDSVSRTTNDEKLFAMSTLHALRGGRISTSEARERLSGRFPRWEDHPILRMLAQDLDAAAGRSLPRPPLADLLAYPFPGDAPVLFSLQRSDRRYQGRAVVRDRARRFLRDSAGRYFSVAQLALSAANLPGYLTNGNTPQGVLSFQGYDVSRNRFIGPTPNLQLVLPAEVSPGVFFHKAIQGDTVWGRVRYLAVLPPEWRLYAPIWEAYYAGEAGRTEIIAHGTAIDPDFYRGKVFFPNTPSLGCLTAPEEWSPVTGQLVRSEQRRLVEALQRVGFEGGFCVVVNIGNDPAPVTDEEIAPLLAAAEQRVSP